MNEVSSNNELRDVQTSSQIENIYKDSERPEGNIFDISNQGFFDLPTTYNDSERPRQSTFDLHDEQFFDDKRTFSKTDNISTCDSISDMNLKVKNVGTATERIEYTSYSKEYYDDNGIKYRDGDFLLPNTRFEVRGYQYETDDKGRVISAEGQLRMKDQRYERDMEDVRKIEGQEYKTTDDRGHLIGHQFDGSDRLENLVPMDAKLNQGDFFKLEKTLADAVKDGADVKLKVEPIYESDSSRPCEFRVTYIIDGDKDVVVFKNESEVKI